MLVGEIIKPEEVINAIIDGFWVYYICGYGNNGFRGSIVNDESIPELQRITRNAIEEKDTIFVKLEKKKEEK